MNTKFEPERTEMENCAGTTAALVAPLPSSLFPPLPPVEPGRRISSGIAGQKSFTFVNPNPSAEGDYIFLDAADQDGDGLSDGYENWFTYGGQRTSRTLPGSDPDMVRDGWEVSHGLNPTDAAGINGDEIPTSGSSLDNRIVYIPEPSAGALALVGALTVSLCRCRRKLS